MINKFLYEFDNRERKVICGVVEDTKESIYEENKEFIALPAEGYKPNNEVVTYNYGNFYFVLFGEDDVKYLDVDFYKDRVKIGLTSKINHASMFSKEMISVILDYVEYFGYDDCKLVPSYTGKNIKKGPTDAFNNYFKKVTDKCYCQIKKNDTSYFLSRKNDKYYLSESFSDAVRVSKNDMRRVLVINELIDSKTNRGHLSFSPYNLFKSNDSYSYYGDNVFKVTFKDGILTIDRNACIDASDKLENDKEIANKIRDLYNMPVLDEEQKYILEINQKYIYKDDCNYYFTTNPKAASYLSDSEIDLLKQAYLLFLDNVSIKKFISDKFYLNKTDEYYEVDTDGSEGLILNSKDYENLMKNVFTTQPILRDGYLAFNDDLYLKLTVLDKKFKIEWVSSYEASILDFEVIKTLGNILKFPYKLKEVKRYNLAIDNKFNVTYNQTSDPFIVYQTILNDITHQPHKMCSFASDNPKVETLKGALEYLRKHYIKNVFDIKNIVSKIDDVKNILVVGNVSNSDLLGIDLAVNKKVNVCIASKKRWGYYPNISLKNVVVNSYYLLDINSLTKNILDNFDLIIFGKAFDRDYNYKNLNNKYLVNTKICNLGEVNDSFYEHFKTKRRYNSIDQDTKNKVKFIHQEFLSDLKKACKCKDNCKIDNIVIDDEYSYFCVVKKHQ